MFIFTGPTISPAEASAELKAVYLPPASEGDVYRVALHRPQAIGIIDGYFQSVPTVRHKEILWAMSCGIHVFGCASIGALRAAELLPFGMEGVGAVFESNAMEFSKTMTRLLWLMGPPKRDLCLHPKPWLTFGKLCEKRSDSVLFQQSCA